MRSTPLLEKECDARGYTLISQIKHPTLIQLNGSSKRQQPHRLQADRATGINRDAPALARRIRCV
jgi:hypothetical protein